MLCQRHNSEFTSMAIKWYKALPFVTALALAFTLAFVAIDDMDVWWHLKCGELFLRDGHVPRTEIFSYTAAGAPWVDGYLPAQALLYFAWWVGGAAGVVVLGALLVMGMYALSMLMTLRDRVGFGVGIAASLPAIFLARVVMLPRPALLTPIFALLTLWLLEDHLLRGGRRVWWIVPLSAIWANCHPAFIFGPVITVIYLAGALLPSPMRRRSPRPHPSRRPDKIGTPQGGGQGEAPETIIRKRLALLLCGQLIATLINPYGYRIYYSAFSLFFNPQLRNTILEWKPLYAEPGEPPGTIECFILIIALWVACALWAGRRIRIEHALLFLFVTLSTVMGRRNLIMFGPLSIPLIAWTAASAEGMGGEAPLRRGRVGKAVVEAGAALITLAGLSLVWISATNRLYFYMEVNSSTGVGIQKALFPEGAADFLAREQIKGNVFHNYGLGGYLIFKLYPKYKVFIDGRIFPYPPGLSQQEDDALVSRRSFENLRERYNIGAALLPISDDNSSRMMFGLMESADWACVQADGAGALFLRRGMNDPVILRHEMDLLKNPPPLPTPPPGREFHWWSMAEYPAEQVYWAQFYEKNGRPDLAARALKPAFNYRPHIADLEAWYGLLLIQSGNLDEGIEIIRGELRKAPSSIIALIGLADYHLKKAEYAEAEEILVNVTRKKPDHAKSWCALGDIAYNRRDYGTAAYRYRRAATLKPDESRYWEKLCMSAQFFDAAAANDACMRALQSYRISGGDAEDIMRVEALLRKITQP